MNFFKKSINRDNHILSIIWLLFLILPNNNIFYLFVPIAYISLIDRKIRIDKTVFHFSIVFFLLFFISYLINMHESYMDLKAIIRVVSLSIMFLSIGRLKGNKILKPYLISAVIFIVVSQLAPLLNLSFITSLISNYYASDGFVDNNLDFTIDQIGKNRLGGIYLNSNNYASFLGLIMTVILCELSQFRKHTVSILIITIIFSIIATGSRTSFIVLMITAAFFIYNSNILSKKQKIIIPSLILLFLFFFFAFISLDLSSFRLLKLEEGINDSFGVKMRILSEYLSADPSILNLLFGNFSGSAMYKFTGSLFVGTDFEIGNLIVYFGFVFFIQVLFFYLFIYKQLLPKYRVIFVVLLWMFSNSILLSYRMSAVWILILSYYYQKSITERKISNEK